MRTIYGTLVLGILVSACGGGGEATKPVEAPPAPTVASAAPTTTAEPAPAATAAPAPAKASLQDMEKAVVTSVADALNAHDPAKFTALYADDAVLVEAGTPEPIKGKENIQTTTKKWLDAFPNTKFGFSRAWGKNDVVVTEWVTNGTHSGEFNGLKATEKPVGYQGLSVVWVNTDGKVKEEHRYYDVGTLLAQVGAGPKGAKARPIPALPTSTEWHWSKGDAAEDKNVDLMKSAYTAFEKKDEKAFLDLNSDDIVWDDMMAPGPSKGKAEAVKMFKSMTTAFPDLKMQVANAWGVEDFALSEVTLTGTQKGAFMGMPATKKPVNLHGVDIVQIKDGKAVKGWSYGNSIELLTQLGLIKAPGATPPAKTDVKPAPKTDAKPATPATKPAAPPATKPEAKPATPATKPEPKPATPLPKK